MGFVPGKKKFLKVYENHFFISRAKESDSFHLFGRDLIVPEALGFWVVPTGTRNEVLERPTKRSRSEAFRALRSSEALRAASSRIRR